MVSSLLYALVLSVLALGSYLYPTRHTPHAPHGPNNDVPIFMRAPSQGYPPAYPMNGTHGAVTCEVDVCSFVGTYLLAKGGSATDAVRIPFLIQATGASICVGVMHAYHSGIGGGGFALVKTNQSEPIMIDYREKAPRGAHQDMFVGLPIEEMYHGGLSIAVPGEIRGWEAMHKLYGKLPWADLIMPSVTIARRGFRIPRQLKMAMDVLDGLICNAPRLNETYCVNGKPKSEGETVHLPDLADTLEAVARDGPDAFYRGPIAERTVAAVQERGGSMTMQDMAEYKVLYRPAQSIPYRNKYRVWSTSVPSSGAVVLSALRTLEHYPEKAFESNDVLATHRMIEAVKFAYGERTRYGDPAFLKNVTGYEAEAISAAAGATRYNKIDDFGTHPVSYYNPALEDSGEDHGTSHINAVDASGMAVSITTTVNLWWGSAVQTEDGILLNDDMDDFSTPGTPNQFGYEPSRANYIEPGKRPLSSMSPMMVEDLHTGELKLIAGSAGGSRIITANLQMVYSYLSSDGRVSMQEVIDRPRWHNQLLPDVTYYEYHSPNVPSLPGFNNVTVAALTALGHDPVWFEPGSSAAQAIQRVGRAWVTASELRQPEARGGAF